MAGKYLIDTNIAIDYLNNKLPEVAADELDKDTLCISVITRMELLAWRGANAEDLNIIEKFIGSAIVHDLEEQIIIKAIEIRKNYSVKLPDAIIAATSLVHGYTLVTRNVSDFKKIRGIKLLNPWR